MSYHEYPDDKVLERGIREQGLSWVARELNVARSTLQHHCERRGIPTRQDPRKVVGSPAFAAIAKRVGK